MTTSLFFVFSFMALRDIKQKTKQKTPKRIDAPKSENAPKSTNIPAPNVSGFVDFCQPSATEHISVIDKIPECNESKASKIARNGKMIRICLPFQIFLSVSNGQVRTEAIGSGSSMTKSLVIPLIRARPFGRNSRRLPQRQRSFGAQIFAP